MERDEIISVLKVSECHRIRASRKLGITEDIDWIQDQQIGLCGKEAR